MVRKTQQSVHSCEITPSYHNVIISVHSSVQLLPATDFCQSVSCTFWLVAGRGNGFTPMLLWVPTHTLPPRAYDLKTRFLVILSLKNMQNLMCGLCYCMKG